MIKVLDHRSRPLDELPSLLSQEFAAAPEALLWTAKRPRKNWHLDFTEMSPHLLATSAQYEQIFWVEPSVALPISSAVQAEHKFLLEAYKELFLGDAPVETCSGWQSYRATLLEHIKEQESRTYPDLIENLPVERPLRELGYEHRGLEKGLKRMPQVLKASREGSLSSREREIFDLDFYHLLEHHLERETEAVYPTISYFQRHSP